MPPPVPSSELASLPPIPRYIGLSGAIIAITLVGMGLGQSTPLFSVLLRNIGASEGLIGLNVALAALVHILVMPLFPRYLALLGMRRFLILNLFAMILSYAGLTFTHEIVWTWFPLRILFAVGAAGLFVASEVWINLFALPDKRGQIIGIYCAALAAGFAAGPLTLVQTGFEGALPWLTGLALYFAAIIPFISTPVPKIAPYESQKGSFFPLFALAPAIFSGTAIFAGAEMAVLSLLPAFVLDIGYLESDAAQLITVYGLGLLCLQYLLGFAADKVGPTRILLLCAFIGVLGCILMPFTFAHRTALLLLLFFWGGSICGIYTINLVLVGEKFDGNALSFANAGLIFMYGIGTMVGPLVAGFSMNLLGGIGLPLWLGILFAGYFILVLVRQTQPFP